MAADRDISFKYKKVDGVRYRPIVPIEIGHIDTLSYEVLVDSGADFCIFDAEVAEAIGIKNLTGGTKIKFGGITGKTEIAYMHKITIKLGDCSFQTKVAFSEHIRDDGTGIVGQKGFFDRFSVTFDYPAKNVVLRKKD